MAYNVPWDPSEGRRAACIREACTRAGQSHWYAFRFEDCAYSTSDEYGDHAYTAQWVELIAYRVHHFTPCGFVIERGGWPQRFVNTQATKQFAHIDIDAARESFIRRKSKQISIYRNREKKAKRAIAKLLRGPWAEPMIGDPK